MAETVTGDELKRLEGRTLEASSWFQITQERIDQFAACTDDHQFIHVDEARAREGPFGATIAHGFLTLSLIPAHGPRDWPRLENLALVLNYGLDRVRFLTPVKVNSRLRVHTRILSVAEKRPGEFLVKAEKTMEIEGEARPAFVAEQLFLMVQRK